MTRACALSATAAAATVLLVGSAAAADDDVLTRKRPTITAIEHVVASLHQPAQLGADFTHQRATQWAWRSDSPEQIPEDDGVD
ncbi:hypothetical protein G7047_16320 [Diaphorobacter sp. HDW4A]|uniref:hypothetical protein n=1 Tax=Diaphorobacter sp. HDW4A TaxID=2714924 RepID=UPI00140A52C5|nr:hypothetical protein [Diaphorobacter sp. HDW4A]QIL81302.1 hypothetical protein G7047_16320 [Diaphorobacter sp. HDW4A]